MNYKLRESYNWHRTVLISPERAVALYFTGRPDVTETGSVEASGRHLL